LNRLTGPSCSEVLNHQFRCVEMLLSSSRSVSSWKRAGKKGELICRKNKRQKSSFVHSNHWWWLIAAVSGWLLRFGFGQFGQTIPEKSGNDVDYWRRFLNVHSLLSRICQNSKKLNCIDHEIMIPGATLRGLMKAKVAIIGGRWNTKRRNRSLAVQWWIIRVTIHFNSRCTLNWTFQYPWPKMIGIVVANIDKELN
jgi:hypothetical protein